MNLRDIQAFLAVSSAQSISKAAEILFLTQPAVSHRIKALEKELNVNLIVRGQGMRTQNTSAGEQFVPIAQQWLSLWNASLNLQNTATRKFLTIGCIDSLNSYIFSPLYRQLIKGDDRLCLNIETHQGSEMPQLLENRVIDIGFAFSPYRYKNTFVTEVFHEKMYLIRLARRSLDEKPLHPASLSPEDEIYLKWSNDYQHWHDSWWGPAAASVHVQINTPSMILTFMEHERQWSIVPESVARALAASGHVTIHSVEPSAPPRICYQLLHDYPNPAREASITFFNEKLNDLVAATEWLNVP